MVYLIHSFKYQILLQDLLTCLLTCEYHPFYVDIKTVCIHVTQFSFSSYLGFTHNQNKTQTLLFYLILIMINLSRLSDCNWNRTHNHLICKQTLKHLAKLAKLANLTKWLSVRQRTKWLWVRVQL